MVLNSVNQRRTNLYRCTYDKTTTLIDQSILGILRKPRSLDVGVLPLSRFLIGDTLDTNCSGTLLSGLSPETTSLLILFRWVGQGPFVPQTISSGKLVQNSSSPLPRFRRTITCVSGSESVALSPRDFGTHTPLFWTKKSDPHVGARTCFIKVQYPRT